MFPVKEIWTNGCALHASGKEWQEFLDEASDRDIPIREVVRGLTWKENFFKISALHPAPLSDPDRDCADLNDGSITLKVTGFGHSAILTGDLTLRGEAEILQTHAFVKTDVLKVGHHGSKSSSGRNFLETVAPDIAVISSGRKNRFRHPHKQVTARLDSLHIPYLNTAKNGTVTVTFSEDSVAVETMLK
jgi:competence protein ComEC